MEWLLVGLLVANLALLAYLGFGSREEKHDDEHLVMLQNQMRQVERRV